jgi:DNA-binding LacI/PurR family transcriptional regulator
MPREKSVYARIAEDLARLIETGAYREHFPSEKELRGIYQVTRKTVRRALALVEGRGLLCPAAGKTRQVISPDAPSRPSGEVACLLSRYATYYAEVCQEIRNQLKQAGYSVAFTFEQQDHGYDRAFFNWPFRGVIILGISEEAIITEIIRQVGGRAMVAINYENCLLPINLVGTNSFLNAYRAAEYLLANGHRRMGGIFSDKFPDSPRGFVQALASHGLSSGKNLWNIDGAEAITAKAMNRFIVAGKLTALYVSPLRRFGQNVLAALGALGLKIPEDLSFLGHDLVDIEVDGKIVLPDCVATDWKKIVEVAVGRLVELMNGDDAVINSNVESRIIPRGTVLPPNERKASIPKPMERTAEYELVET